MPTLLLRRGLEQRDDRLRWVGFRAGELLDDYRAEDGRDGRVLYPTGPFSVKSEWYRRHGAEYCYSRTSARGAKGLLEAAEVVWTTHDGQTRRSMMVAGKGPKVTERADSALYYNEEDELVALCGLAYGRVPFSEAIAAAAPTAEAADIAGIPCYRAETAAQGLSVWVAPHLGYAVVRCEQTRTDERGKWQIIGRFGGFTKLADGLFVPTWAIRTSCVPSNHPDEAKAGVTIRADFVVAGFRDFVLEPPLAPEPFGIDVPAGATVEHLPESRFTSVGWPWRELLDIAEWARTGKPPFGITMEEYKNP